MNSPYTGHNLIFILSQPRAGSTLLQRILGSHSEIHALGEPWFMLPPFYVLRPDNYEAEYTSHGALLGLRSFLRSLARGEEEYYEAVRRMAGYLYGCALAASGKRFFLDKTPRYFLIIPELLRTFPAARFLFLFRNPLAVLCSIRERWLGDNWLGCPNHRIDLIDAPRLLTEGRALLAEKGLTVSYEHLVAHPEDQIRRMCDWLGLSFSPTLVEYGRNGMERWDMGDPQRVYEHRRPTAEYVDKWMQALEQPQAWRMVHDYLEILGPTLVEQMGFSFTAIRALVEARRPAAHSLWTTFSLDAVLREDRPLRRRLLAGWQRLRSAVGRHGLTGVAWRAVRKIVALTP
jgi:hypothetical protein